MLTICNRGRLGRAERKQYIAAVQCLQKLPARTPPSLVPGAKSRFDDFVATHINQTLTIHYTVRSPLCTHETDTHMTGHFPRLAPLVHVGVRAGSPQRMRLHGRPALLGLGRHRRRQQHP